jgi:hypothetical protein
LKEGKTFTANHPRGGGLEVQFSEEAELGRTILSCLADNQNYLVKNPKIKELIFSLVKENIKKESLVITQNMVRFLALQLIKKDKILILKVANIVVSSKNRVRLLTRTLGSIAIGVISALVSTLPVVIFSDSCLFPRNRKLWLQL